MTAYLLEKTFEAEAGGPGNVNLLAIDCDSFRKSRGKRNCCKYLHIAERTI